MAQERERAVLCRSHLYRMQPVLHDRPTALSNGRSRGALVSREAADFPSRGSALPGSDERMSGSSHRGRWSACAARQSGCACGLTSMRSVFGAPHWTTAKLPAFLGFRLLLPVSIRFLQAKVIFCPARLLFGENPETDVREQSQFFVR